LRFPATRAQTKTSYIITYLWSSWHNSIFDYKLRKKLRTIEVEKLKRVRTASFNLKFSGSYKKVHNVLKNLELGGSFKLHIKYKVVWVFIQATPDGLGANY